MSPSSPHSPDATTASASGLDAPRDRPRPAIATSARQLADALRAARLARGLTQQALADAAATSQRVVSRLETDPDARSLDVLFRVLAALELELVVAPRPGDAPAATATATATGRDAPAPEW